MYYGNKLYVAVIVLVLVDDDDARAQARFCGLFRLLVLPMAICID